MKLPHGLLLNIMALLFASSTAAFGLSPYQAHYEVSRGGSQYGEAERHLTRTAQSYQLYTETEISWMFLSDRRRYWSEFQFQDDQIDSLNFRYHRSGTGSDKKFHGQFVQTDKRLINAETKRPYEVDIEQHRMDEAASVEQLRYDVSQGKEHFHYYVVDENGNPDELIYERRGVEELNDLPYGKVTAIKVSRIRENSKRETDYWFAPELDYVLVKMVQRENGKEVAALRLAELD